MFRRLIPLAAALALVLGCNKKKDESGGAPPDAAPAPGAGAGSGGGGAMAGGYTIKIREAQKGDKLHVVGSYKERAEVNIGGKGQTLKEGETYDYVETVLEKPAGAREATKATRHYKKSEATGPTGVTLDTPYSGKTVSIELKGGKYSFSVAGKEMSDAEAGHLAKEFRKVEKSNTSVLPLLLPKGPVKLNAPWSVDRAGVQAMTGIEGAALDLEASSITGKLVKVYDKDGKKWGTIEFAINIVIKRVVIKEFGPKVPPFGGSVTGAITVDCPIDGSSPEGREVTKVSSELRPVGADAPVSIKGSEERTQTVAVAK